MVATPYCKGIAALIVACFVGYRVSVYLFAEVHPYMNDLCTFCESAFFCHLFGLFFFVGGLRVGGCMGMDGDRCVWM